MTEEKPKIALYDKMADYVESLFNVFQLINKKSNQYKDKRLNMISIMVFNYTNQKAIEHNININDFNQPEVINLIPIFEYISYNNIELYDFSNININDVDTTNNSDLEKFVLTHVYYITQQQK